MNKKMNIFLKIIIFSAVIFIEQYLFYEMILSNTLTGRSIDIWISFIAGSLALTLANTVIILVLINKNKLKPDSVAILTVSSVLISLYVMILSLCSGENILGDTDYSDEISFFVLFILSASVTVCTIISNIIYRIYQMVKNSYK